MKRSRLAVFALIAFGLVAAIFLVRNRGHSLTSGNYKSLEILCTGAYSGNTTATAQLVGSGTNSIPGLVELLQKHDSFFRNKAWRLLRKLPPRIRLQLATRFPPTAAEYVRESAAHGLGLLGPQAHEAIPDLIRALPDKEGRVSVEAAWALSRVGEAALPALLIALQNQDSRVRHSAINAIIQMNPKSRLALPNLVQLLDDPVEQVRSSAAYALTAMGLPGTFALISVADEGSPHARNAASNVLAGAYLTIRSAESSLYLMTQDTSPIRRERAIKALSRLRGAGDLAVDTATYLLQDAVVEVRVAAIEVLGAMGSRSQPSIPQLLPLASAPEECIRNAARRAIEEIESKKPGR